MTQRSLFLTASLAALILLASCGGSTGDEDNDHRAVALVEASEVTRAPAALSVPARVRSENTVQLATRTSGTIRRILVDVGDVVREGQDLVLLEDADVRASVARAEARLELERRTRDRIAALERDGAATGQELDEATARLQVAEAGLTEARSGLRYAVLRAPFGGVVSARHADPGDLAVPGRSLLEVSGAGDLIVEADLSARLSVQQGQQVRIEQSAGPKGSWVAEITRVVPVLDRASQTFRVEARLVATDGPLPVPNSIVGLRIPSESDSVLVVPADAMLSRGQLTGVFLVRGTGLRLRWIRPGREWGSTLEVLSGLAPGDTVVRRPDHALVDGQLVDSVAVVRWSQQQDGVQ
jgi:RND family efflux transporter MFP subunit